MIRDRLATSTPVHAAWLFVVAIACAGCTERDSLGPPTIYYGEDICAVCGMIISDARFAAAAIVPTTRGPEPRLFDDLGCLLRYDVESPGAVRHYVRAMRADRWLPLEAAQFVHSPALPTPMASGVAAVASVEDGQRLLSDYPGEMFDVTELRRRHAANALGVAERRQERPDEG